MTTLECFILNNRQQPTKQLYMATKIGNTPLISKIKIDLLDTKNNLKTALNSSKELKDKGLDSSQDSNIPVNLLHSPQRHRFDFYEKYDCEQGERVYYTQKTEYINGEYVVCSGSYIERGNISNIAPRKVGENIEQKGLSRQQATEIRRTVRVMQYLSHNNMLTFLTLTYGWDYPNDIEAKKHLDTFFKRLRRKYGNGRDFHYMWVAEKQKRGAIHYHIVLIDYIPIKFVKKCWDGVVQKWQKANGFKIQGLQPNIKGVETLSDATGISKYLSKAFQRIGGYLTKKGKEHTIQEIKGNIWSRAAVTRDACKGEKYRHIADSKAEAIEAYNNLAYEAETDNTVIAFEHEIEDTNVRILIVKPKEQNEVTAPEQAPIQAPIQYQFIKAYPQEVSEIQDNIITNLWA